MFCKWIILFHFYFNPLKSEFLVNDDDRSYLEQSIFKNEYFIVNWSDIYTFFVVNKFVWDSFYWCVSWFWFLVWMNDDLVARQVVALVCSFMVHFCIVSPKFLSYLSYFTIKGTWCYIVRVFKGFWDINGMKMSFLFIAQVR